MNPPHAVSDYKIISDTSRDGVAEQVRRLIVDGWVIWGIPYATGRYHTNHAQCMIKWGRRNQVVLDRNNVNPAPEAPDTTIEAPEFFEDNIFNG